MAPSRAAEWKERNWLSVHQSLVMLDECRHHGPLIRLFGVDYDFVSLPSRQDMSSIRRPLTYIVGFSTKNKKKIGRVNPRSNRKYGSPFTRFSISQLWSLKVLSMLETFFLERPSEINNQVRWCGELYPSIGEKLWIKKLEADILTFHLV